MPSFAEIKAKAVDISSAGADKIRDVGRRNTSVPMAKTNWNPYEKPEPPPPPKSIINQNTKPVSFPPPPSRTSSAVSRSSSASSVPPLPSRGPPPPPPRGSAVSPPLPSRHSGPPPGTAVLPPPVVRPPAPPPQPNLSYGPPPIVRSTRPDFHAPSKPRTTSSDTEIDWSNLSPEDKTTFFNWLDEFFANFTPPGITRDAAVAHRPAIAPSSHAPPPLQSSTKPMSRNRAPTGNPSTFTLSYPPHTKHGSAALDLVHYFAPSTHWSDVWYIGKMPLPPPLVGSTHSMPTLSMMSRGSQKTISIGAIFSDLSMFWGTVEFSTNNPSDMSQVKRNAVYLPRPKALGPQELVEAHELYGETIALFAESFLGTGQPCSRGECWDLADQALKYFAQYDYIPKPVQSTGRTHGHLIYEGKASNEGKEMEGRWRGGDDRIRRGDIAEWREVKIGTKGGYSILGFPDHTAVVVNDSIPLPTAKDGCSLKPSDLGTITVVEQSQGHPPSRKDYNLSHLQQGEMWIYRPIGMKAYLEVDELTVEPPEEVQTLLQSL